MKMLALVSQLAISMLTAIFICGVIGYYVDYLFGTKIFIFFLILGVLGGYKTCYNVICKFLGRKSLFDREKKREDWANAAAPKSTHKSNKSN